LEPLSVLIALAQGDQGQTEEAQSF